MSDWESGSPWDVVVYTRREKKEDDDRSRAAGSGIARDDGREKGQDEGRRGGSFLKAPGARHHPRANGALGRFTAEHSLLGASKNRIEK